MHNVTVLHRQSLLDIAIQETGTVESVMELCLLNDLSITAQLQIGSYLNTEVEATLTHGDVLKYYKSKQLKPATAISYIGGYSALEYVLINYWL